MTRKTAVILGIVILTFGWIALIVAFAVFPDSLEVRYWLGLGGFALCMYGMLVSISFILNSRVWLSIEELEVQIIKTRKEWREANAFIEVLKKETFKRGLMSKRTLLNRVEKELRKK